MRYFALPAASRRSGRPWCLAVRPFLDLGPSDPPPPLGTVVVPTRWPSARLFAGAPASVPGTECWNRLALEGQQATTAAWERWIDGLIAEAILLPDGILSSRWLGGDRDVAWRALLITWSFMPDDTSGFQHLPSDAMLDILRVMAVRLRRRPSELVRGSFPAFVFDYRAVVAPRDAGRNAILGATDEG